MEEKQVEVIKKVDGPIVRDSRLIGKPLTIERKRVAAYVRVSTNGEEQIQSFNSQKQYYQDKISSNKEWVMVGIYADEGITGTKTNKRDEFLRMIDDCMNGLIDIVITKSVSRFSRNLVDTLSYTRMLKSKGVTVIFEKENIDTSKMESEMQLSLLSALAQNEVESLSQNVTMGVQMKMSRGELMGFNGCLGYDYHPEDKSVTINESEAETVRLIFDLYLQGYGAYRIAKELTRLGKVNKKGVVKWTDSGVRGIIKNEKYKGDLLMGKTYTVDPIIKPPLRNRINCISLSHKQITLILLIRFLRGGLIIVGNRISITQKTTMKPLFQRKSGIRHRRFLKADTGQTRMYPRQKELSLQENMLSAVCANAVSVEQISRDAHIIRIHSIKSLCGNAGQQATKE